MSDLNFISDVIYHLKREYGKRAVVCRGSATVDLATGAKVTTSVVRQDISRIIFLPMSWRKIMANKQKGGIREIGTQEILVDRADLPTGFEFKSGDYLECEGRRIDIGEVDNYDYAFIVYAKSLEGMPLG